MCHQVIVRLIDTTKNITKMASGVKRSIWIWYTAQWESPSWYIYYKHIAST